MWGATLNFSFGWLGIITSKLCHRQRDFELGGQLATDAAFPYCQYSVTQLTELTGGSPIPALISRDFFSPILSV
jgi:hypothetical protein